MHALTLMLRRVNDGWAVVLTDGRELARFRGLGAKRRALRYLATPGLVRGLSHVR
jgi:hypothetical protein